MLEGQGLCLRVGSDTEEIDGWRAVDFTRFPVYYPINSLLNPINISREGNIKFLNMTRTYQLGVPRRTISIKKMAVFIPEAHNLFRRILRLLFYHNASCV